MKNKYLEKAIEIFNNHELDTFDYTKANAMIFINRMKKETNNSEYWLNVEFELKNL